MHPFGSYLAIIDGQREYGWSGDERRATFAREDALPMVTPEPRSRSTSRVARLATILRRRVVRSVGV